jgi:hypothetical protein
MRVSLTAWTALERNHALWPKDWSAACEDVVLAVRAVDPCSGRERGDDRRGLEVVDKGLAGTSRGLRGALSGGGADNGCAEKKNGNGGRG